MPGPWYTKFTDIVLAYRDLVGTRWSYVHELHKTYGSIVRLGPDEIAVNDPQEFTNIHAVGSEFRKRQQPGTPFNIFSMSDPKEHRSRRRFYATKFTDQYIKSSKEQAIHQLASLAIGKMKDSAREHPEQHVDLLKWALLFANDVASDIVFGNGPVAGLLANDGSIDDVFLGGYLQVMIAWARFSLPLFLLGRCLSPLSKSLREIFRPEWRYRDILESGPRQQQIAARTTFAQDAEYSKEDNSYTLHDQVTLKDIDIAHDCSTFIGAGAEPVCTTLVYMLWEILRRPELQRQVEDELRTIAPPLTASKVAELPVLDAVIFESLRLYGGGVTFLPRYAPVVTEMGGYTIPAHTCVTTHIPSLHRNPAIWDNAETYAPNVLS